jgi:hypothetical protein
MSPGFASLPPSERRQIARDLAKVVSFMGGEVDQPARGKRGSVDFPDFVASLIEGTFTAIVNASISQMKAYAELVCAVARSVDDFTRSNDSKGAERRRLATKLLTGIDRIVVRQARRRRRVTTSSAATPPRNATPPELPA